MKIKSPQGGFFLPVVQQSPLSSVKVYVKQHVAFW
jgi:hypothetical protein